MAYTGHVRVCACLFDFRVGPASVERPPMTRPLNSMLLLARTTVLALPLLGFATFLNCSSRADEPTPPTVIMVIGASGGAQYASNFLVQAVAWQKACSNAP